MRIAIVTDIHEDFCMLEKSLDVLGDKGYDILVCLGDITGFSPRFYDHKPDAEACIDFLREHSQLTVAGNHDLHTAKRLPSYHAQYKIPECWHDLPIDQQLQLTKDRLWLYEDEIIPKISAQNLTFLQNLKEWDTIEEHGKKYLFSHFFSPDFAGIEKRFLTNSIGVWPHFRFMAENDCCLSFVGHAHPPGPSIVSRLAWRNHGYKSTIVKVKPGAVICPAATENLRPACCTIFDTAKNEIIPILII